MNNNNSNAVLAARPFINAAHALEAAAVHSATSNDWAMIATSCKGKPSFLPAHDGADWCDEVSVSLSFNVRAAALANVERMLGNSMGAHAALELGGFHFNYDAAERLDLEPVYVGGSECIEGVLARNLSTVLAESLTRSKSTTAVVLNRGQLVVLRRALVAARSEVTDAWGRSTIGSSWASLRGAIDAVDNADAVAALGAYFALESNEAGAAVRHLARAIRLSLRKAGAEHLETRAQLATLTQLVGEVAEANAETSVDGAPLLCDVERALRSQLEAEILGEGDLERLVDHADAGEAPSTHAERQLARRASLAKALASNGRQLVGIRSAGPGSTCFVEQLAAKVAELSTTHAERELEAAAAAAVEADAKVEAAEAADAANAERTFERGDADELGAKIRSSSHAATLAGAKYDAQLAHESLVEAAEQFARLDPDERIGGVELVTAYNAAADAAERAQHKAEDGEAFAVKLAAGTPAGDALEEVAAEREEREHAEADAADAAALAQLNAADAADAAKIAAAQADARLDAAESAYADAVDGDGLGHGDEAKVERLADKMHDAADAAQVAADALVEATKSATAAQLEAERLEHSAAAAESAYADAEAADVDAGTSSARAQRLADKMDRTADAAHNAREAADAQLVDYDAAVEVLDAAAQASADADAQASAAAAEALAPIVEARDRAKAHAEAMREAADYAENVALAIETQIAEGDTADSGADVNMSHETREEADESEADAAEAEAQLAEVEADLDAAQALEAAYWAEVNDGEVDENGATSAASEAKAKRLADALKIAQLEAEVAELHAARVADVETLRARVRVLEADVETLRALELGVAELRVEERDEACAKVAQLEAEVAEVDAQRQRETRRADAHLERAQLWDARADAHLERVRVLEAEVAELRAAAKEAN